MTCLSTSHKPNSTDLSPFDPNASSSKAELKAVSCDLLGIEKFNSPGSPEERSYTQLPAEGLVRLSSILAPNGPIPISRSLWWELVRSGVYPQPVKLSQRVTCWRVEDIRTLIANPKAWERNHG